LSEWLPSLKPFERRRSFPYPLGDTGGPLFSADGAVRFRIALLLVALSIAGAATGAVVAKGNPTGQWATANGIKTVILSRVLGVTLCNGGACKIGQPAKQLGVDAEVVSRVVSATVTGVGPYKLINGEHRYLLFNVRACTIYYYRGAHRFGVHFRWVTQRPPGGATTILAVTAVSRSAGTAASRTPGTGTTHSSRRSPATAAKRVRAAHFWTPTSSSRGRVLARVLVCVSPACHRLRARGIPRTPSRFRLSRRAEKAHTGFEPVPPP